MTKQVEKKVEIWERRMLRKMLKMRESSKSEVAWPRLPDAHNIFSIKFRSIYDADAFIPSIQIIVEHVPV